MRFRLPLLPALLALALVVGGADGCSSDPNVEGAKLKIRTEDFDGALANLNTALEEDPDNVEALRLKSQVLTLQMEKAPVAERAAFIPELQATITRAARLAPEDADVAAMRGFAWAQMLNTGNQSLQNERTPAAESIPFFEGAIAVNPDSVGGHFGLGLAQLLSSNSAAAATAFENTLEMDPGYTNASIYLSKAYLQMDRGADAVTVLEKARTMVADEDRDRLQQEYLNTLASSGQSDRAIAEFETQVDNFPNDPLIRYNYGTLLLGVDRFADAIEQFEAASMMEDDNADAFYNLGVARLREAGRIETEAGALDLSEQDTYDSMIAQRDELIEGSLSALTTARDLADGATRPTVCRTLVTIYNSLGRADDATSAQACADGGM
ncbi:tetratricopeptide repeat protein [Rubricoccus marinus]|uniref:Tetratricopeptide repeat protein n=1 Tax=Rubricoccus marinus TaxID=716817 RepID=A0A259U091_9BACT|nr:tetratricopeptide repeat protein [Rubricoccus marinus]OZC03257.1 hypothetical protein BSZ36_09875 [Rubricoccus marinus]